VYKSPLTPFVPQVANAFVVLLLFSSLFAVMSVMFFKEKDTSQGLFDNFSIALFTMFQITTGDGWVRRCLVCRMFRV
jgi:hypothetical protein